MPANTRDRVAVILASSAGISVVAITAAGLVDALVHPDPAGLSPAYASLITGTLGVLVGALAGYLGHRWEHAPAPAVAEVVPAPQPDGGLTDGQ